MWIGLHDEGIGTFVVVAEAEGESKTEVGEDGRGGKFVGLMTPE